MVRAMALAQRMEIKQGQGLVLTPQLQQAIKLLQLSGAELEAFVDSELGRNPLLDREESEPVEAKADAPSAERELSADGAAASAGDVDASFDDLHPGADAPSAAQPGLSDWSSAGGGGGMSSDDGFDWDGLADRGRTLHEHLEAQLATAKLDATDRAVALALIEAVDEGGYLRADLVELAERLGCDLDRVLRVLGRLQAFEPVGVFARDLKECLSLQLADRNRLDPAMSAMLDHLDLLARRDMAGLRRVCGVDAEDLADMITELKALTPRPGAVFGGEPIAPVIPDVFVQEGPGGLWRVELNSDALPKVLVNQRYHAQVAGAARSDQDRAFLSDCLQQANWLVKSLDQRARTILKVASEIVRQQDGFLAYGVEHLRPLNLKTVADAIGMHESTVSRVTSNKYLATPRGLFEMKFFFTTAIASSDGGEAHSAESVRHKIKALIDSERGPEDVLSDDRIVEILKEAGVDIARRTVAKYREALRIPSSVERKRMAMSA
jgi:RNA polymerase sigma-54 factor